MPAASEYAFLIRRISRYRAYRTGKGGKIRLTLGSEIFGRFLLFLGFLFLRWTARKLRRNLRERNLLSFAHPPPSDRFRVCLQLPRRMKSNLKMKTGIGKTRCFAGADRWGGIGRRVLLLSVSSPFLGSVSSFMRERNRKR